MSETKRVGGVIVSHGQLANELIAAQGTFAGSNCASRMGRDGEFVDGGTGHSTVAADGLPASVTDPKVTDRFQSFSCRRC